MIGLLHYDTGFERGDPVGIDTIWDGSVVLMIEVTDVESVAQDLKDAGATIIQDVAPFSVRGSDGETINSKNLFVADPDGTVIEIAERWH